LSLQYANGELCATVSLSELVDVFQVPEDSRDTISGA
jgi:hypothetical protein